MKRHWISLGNGSCLLLLGCCIAAGPAAHGRTGARDADAVGKEFAAAGSAKQFAIPVNLVPGSSPAAKVLKVTKSAATNGLRLKAAYGAAKASLPNGNPLAANNRAVVLVPPGRYDLGDGQLLMDTDFVDLIGVSTARDD